MSTRQQEGNGQTNPNFLSVEMPERREDGEQVGEYDLYWSDDKAADNIEAESIDVLAVDIDAEVDPHGEEDEDKQVDGGLAQDVVELYLLEQVV